MNEDTVEEQAHSQQDAPQGDEPCPGARIFTGQLFRIYVAVAQTRMGRRASGLIAVNNKEMFLCFDPPAAVTQIPDHSFIIFNFSLRRETSLGVEFRPRRAAAFEQIHDILMTVARSQL